MDLYSLNVFEATFIFFLGKNNYMLINKIDTKKGIFQP